MRNKLRLTLCLILCAGLLAGCSGGNDSPYQVITSPTQAINYGPTPTPTVALGGNVDGVIDFDDGSYDPAQEEDYEENTGSVFDSTYAPPLTVETPTVAPTVNSQYAGATPVVIDPIDKPTPTPLPALTFTHQTYEATKLHLRFNAPVGWIVDDSATDTYILTQPDSEAVPGYPARLTVRVTTVNSQYSSSDMAQEVRQMLDTIGAGFASFSESLTAERTLLDKAGVYANYTAVTSDGVEAAGRVHVTCIDRTLYSLHITYPRGYRETYVDQVYDQFRKTVEITQ